MLLASDRQPLTSEPGQDGQPEGTVHREYRPDRNAPMPLKLRANCTNFRNRRVLRRRLYLTAQTRVHEIDHPEGRLSSRQAGLPTRFCCGIARGRHHIRSQKREKRQRRFPDFAGIKDQVSDVEHVDNHVSARINDEQLVAHHDVFVPAVSRDDPHDVRRQTVIGHCPRNPGAN